jgi:hypothetical protein
MYFDLAEFCKDLHGLTVQEASSRIEAKMISLESLDRRPKPKGKNPLTPRYDYRSDINALNQLLHEVKWGGFTNATGWLRDLFTEVHNNLKK